MGLKQDLIDAKVNALKESLQESIEMDTGPGSLIEREAEYTKEAIVKFLTEAEFTITQLKAPVIIEELKTPDQGINVKLETLLGDKAPILKTLKKIGKIIPGAGAVVEKLVDELESSIQKAVQPLLEDGAIMPGLNLSKDGQQGDSGGLISRGYVYIGEDPTSQENFNIEDSGGQSEYTTVKVFREDIEDLL